MNPTALANSVDAGTRRLAGPSLKRPAVDVSARSSASYWLRELARVALVPGRSGSIGDLTRVLAQAAEMEGAILWERVRAQDGIGTPSVLALWLESDHEPSLTRPVNAGDLTGLALESRTLAMEGDVPGQAECQFGVPVAAALPIDFSDGTLGASHFLAIMALPTRHST